MSCDMMKAVVVEKYGRVENLVPRAVPNPGEPKGRDLLIKYTSIQPRKQDYHHYGTLIIVSGQGRSLLGESHRR